MTTYCNPKPFDDLWISKGYDFTDYWNLAMFGALRRTFSVSNLQHEFGLRPQVFKLLPAEPEVAQQLGFKWYRGRPCATCQSKLRHPYEDHCVNCSSTPSTHPDHLTRSARSLETHRSKMKLKLQAEPR